MIHDDVLQCLNQRPSYFWDELFAYDLHRIENIFPYEIHIDGFAARGRSIFLFLWDLGRVVSHIHEHANRCEIRIDVFIFLFCIPFNAIQNTYEVLLAQFLNVVGYDQFQAFEAIWNNCLLKFIDFWGLDIIVHTRQQRDFTGFSEIIDDQGPAFGFHILTAELYDLFDWSQCEELFLSRGVIVEHYLGYWL